MPDTWTPIFDLSDSERNAETNRKADAAIEEAAERIKNREKGGFHTSRVPWIFYPVFNLIYSAMRRTRSFRALDRCTGCGRCASLCPSGVLKMSDGRPVWTENKCAACLRCLHTCPVFAIQYGGNTEKHGQYVHPLSGKPG